MITIDGSFGEGGGQLIRTALALSTAVGKAFDAESIRKGRTNPGLKAQHLACINALEKFCNARADNADIGSSKIRYVPGKIKGGGISVDIGTAGSITLLLQSLLPACIVSGKKSKIEITGGTSGKWQMPADYFINVMVPQLRRYANIEAKVVKRGYYPKGGGKVEISINPKFNFENRNKAPKIDLTEQGHLQYVKGISHASTFLQADQVAERQAKAAEIQLRELGCPVSIDSQYAGTLSSGSGITLWAVFSKAKDDIDMQNPIIVGADTIGEKGKPAEDVGTEAAKALINEVNSGAPVDEHLADNLIPFLAFFGGKIKVSKISSHALSNIYACEQFLGKTFSVSKEDNIIEAKNQELPAAN